MDTPKPAPLDKAISLLGSQSAVARAVGIRPQSVNEIVLRGSRIPAEWCLPIERATEGKVTRHDLRPDLYPVESDSTPSNSEAA